MDTSSYFDGTLGALETQGLSLRATATTETNTDSNTSVCAITNVWIPTPAFTYNTLEGEVLVISVHFVHCYLASRM